MKGQTIMTDRKTQIIAVANQKGGVAKTTTAINIAAGISAKGKKVLLVDIDSQNHLTRWLGYSPDGNPTISELIYQTVANFPTPMDSFIRHNDNLNVDYIPANAMLSGILAILATDSDSSTVFVRIFDNPFFRRYDYIIIDCQTSLDLLVTNALKCSDKVIIPVQADMLAYEGVELMLNTIAKINPQKPLADSVMMLLTMYHKTTNVSKEIFAALKESYKSLVISTPIPYRTEAKVSSIERTALVNKKNSCVGEAYMNVVEELLGGNKNG